MNIQEKARLNLENESMNEINRIINLSEINTKEINIKIKEYKNYLIKYLPLKNKNIDLERALSFSNESLNSLRKKLEKLDYYKEQEAKEKKEEKLRKKKEKEEKKNKKKLLEDNSLKIEEISLLKENTYKQLKTKINKYKKISCDENINNLKISDLVKCTKKIKELNNKIIKSNLKEIINEDKLELEEKDKEYSINMNLYIDFLNERQKELEKNEEINLKLISERMSQELTRDKQESCKLVDTYTKYNNTKFSDYLEKKGLKVLTAIYN